MTKNEAYKYAKSVRRLNLTKQALENKMFSAGYSPRGCPDGKRLVVTRKSWCLVVDTASENL